MSFANSGTGDPRVERGSAPSLNNTSTLSLPSAENEEAALQVFADLLDSISPEGLSSISSAFCGSNEGNAGTPSLAQLQLWRSALTTLSRFVPLNGMLADTLLERVNAAFAVHLRAFQDALQQQQHQQNQEKRTTLKIGQLSRTVVGAALQALCAAYDQIFSLLQGWCDALGVPGVAAFFSVRVRCTLLQADLISGEEPCSKRALFSFLRQHGHELLSHDPHRRDQGCGSSSSNSGAEEDYNDQDGEAATNRSLKKVIHSPALDPIIGCLHRLTLSQSNEMKQLWRSVLETRIHGKLCDLSDDFSTHFLHEQIAWLEDCVMPFVAMVLDAPGDEDELSCPRELNEGSRDGGAVSASHGKLVRDSTHEAARAEREAWCAEMRHLFLYSYARRRLDSFWEILSDYPDSIPALEDMHYCLQSNPESGLKAELMQTVRHLLSSRLHRAGTRTEDILAILTNTIHAFCVLFPRNEQNSVVFAVIADTLEHLRRRKDCVTAIVQAVMQPNGAINAAAAAALPPPPRPLPSGVLTHDGYAVPNNAGGVGGVNDGLDFFDGLNDGGAGVCREGELYRTGSRDRPDVLRVLLTSIHRRALVEEYQHVLAEQLLQKPMHDFDTTPEEEVLERLKQVFGETVLDKCAVMVRDLQMSRRMTQQLREQLARRYGTAARNTVIANHNGSNSWIPAASCSVSVLSMTTWPPLARLSASDATAASVGVQSFPSNYRPHPSLQTQMDALAEAYKQLKENQRLAWIPSLGRVELELTQRDPSKGNAPVAVQQVLPLFDASVVLFVEEMTSSSNMSSESGDQTNRGVNSAAVPLDWVAKALGVSVEAVRPHVQRLSPTILVMPSDETVAMQLSVASSSDYVFMEDTSVSEAEAKPTSLPPERVKLMERMVTSLLKTRGPQSGTAIHSSLKLLAKFEGTNADLLELLQSFMRRDLIVMNEAKLYALPPR